MKNQCRAGTRGRIGELTKRVGVRDDAVSHATGGYAAALELAWPASHRRLDREVWGRVILAMFIATLTGALLTTEVHRPPRLVALTVVFTAVWVLALWKTGAVNRSRGVEPVIVAAVGTAVGFAAISLVNAWLLSALIRPNTIVYMSASVFVVAATFQAVASRRFAPRRRVAVVGTDDAAQDLIREIGDGTNPEFECIGVIANRVNGTELSGMRILGRNADVIEIVRHGRPELIVCSSARARTRTVGRLLDAGVTSVRVVDLLEFSEIAFRRVASRPLPPSWFAGVLDVDVKHYSSGAKRVFDATIAATGLVLCAPLFLVIALLVRLSGPIFYRQVRSGERGEPFEMLKFRTMIPDAEVGGAVWASKNDPRVTRVGRLLRKLRLDELPQFWNVLKGEMSIVGPRPERPEYVEILLKEVPFWNRRHLLKPGITGWAQVHLAYTDDINSAASKLSYDLYYLKHRSLRLDFVILLKTVKVILAGTGAR